MEKKEKNIKTTSNKIYYKGTVTINAVDKKGKVRKITQHNTGMPGMFNFLLFCMAYKYKEILTPSCLMGYTDVEGNNEAFITTIPILNNPKLYRKEAGGYIETETTPVNRVEYSVIVPSSRFKQTPLQLRCLRLFNKEAEVSGDLSDADCCAKLPLTTTELTLADENLLIYWDIEFKEEEGTNSISTSSAEE